MTEAELKENIKNALIEDIDERIENGESNIDNQKIELMNGLDIDSKIESLSSEFVPKNAGEDERNYLIHAAKSGFKAMFCKFGQLRFIHKDEQLLNDTGQAIGDATGLIQKLRIQEQLENWYNFKLDQVERLSGRKKDETEDSWERRKENLGIRRMQTKAQIDAGLQKFDELYGNWDSYSFKHWSRNINLMYGLLPNLLIELRDADRELRRKRALDYLKTVKAGDGKVGIVVDYDDKGVPKIEPIRGLDEIANSIYDKFLQKFTTTFEGRDAEVAKNAYAENDIYTFGLYMVDKNGADMRDSLATMMVIYSDAILTGSTEKTKQFYKFKLPIKTVKDILKLKYGLSPEKPEEEKKKGGFKKFLGNVFPTFTGTVGSSEEGEKLKSSGSGGMNIGTIFKKNNNKLEDVQTSAQDPEVSNEATKKDASPPQTIASDDGSNVEIISSEGPEELVADPVESISQVTNQEGESNVINEGDVINNQETNNISSNTINQNQNTASETDAKNISEGSTNVVNSAINTVNEEISNIEDNKLKNFFNNAISKITGKNDANFKDLLKGSSDMAKSSLFKSPLDLKGDEIKNKVDDKLSTVNSMISGAKDNIASVKNNNILNKVVNNPTVTNAVNEETKILEKLANNIQNSFDNTSNNTAQSNVTSSESSNINTETNRSSESSSMISKNETAPTSSEEGIVNQVNVDNREVERNLRQIKNILQGGIEVKIT